MGTNRFYISIIIRVIFITLTCFAMVWVYTVLHLPATSIFIFVTLIVQAIALVYFLNQTNRDLANFLVFLHENDTTLAYSKSRINKNFSGLTASLDNINRKVQQARLEKEQNYHYLQAVIEHIAIGLVAFNNNGHIEFLNNSAKKMLGIPDIQNVNDFKVRFPEIAHFFMPNADAIQNSVKLTVGGNVMWLAFKTSSLKFNDNTVTLLSFQNIQTELEAQELDSWRKLIRVLRHEIMNSVTPITTLTAAIRRSFSANGVKKQISEIESENIDDALQSAEVIEERSKGLVSFVERFSSLIHLPKPEFNSFNLLKLFENIMVLFNTELQQRNIKVILRLPEHGMEIKADEKLLEQVFINLVKNAMEAIDGENGVITLAASAIQPKKVLLQVLDNGCGIAQAHSASIFVPSFTTKENGSGIGLSLSKQIVQLHGGSIGVRPAYPNGTIIDIYLPQ
jgi:two-component system nitrogen regulation sensor histidine kinase NtrY